MEEQRIKQQKHKIITKIVEFKPSLNKRIQENSSCQNEHPLQV